jgi:hypothetical protein
MGPEAPHSRYSHTVKRTGGQGKRGRHHDRIRTARAVVDIIACATIMIAVGQLGGDAAPNEPHNRDRK